MIAIENCSLNKPGPDTTNGNDSNSNYVVSDRLSIHILPKRAGFDTLY